MCQKGKKAHVCCRNIQRGRGNTICVFTGVSTCTCSTLHVVILCVLLNVTRTKSKQADETKNKQKMMQFSTHYLIGWLQHTQNACPFFLTSRASSERQSEDTYTPLIHPCFAKALKTSKNALRDPKFTYWGGQSANFRINPGAFHNLLFR